MGFANSLVVNSTIGNTNKGLLLLMAPYIRVLLM